MARLISIPRGSSQFLEELNATNPKELGLVGLRHWIFAIERRRFHIDRMLERIKLDKEFNSPSPRARELEAEHKELFGHLLRFRGSLPKTASILPLVDEQKIEVPEPSCTPPEKKLGRPRKPDAPSEAPRLSPDQAAIEALRSRLTELEEKIPRLQASGNAKSPELQALVSEQRSNVGLLAKLEYLQSLMSGSVQGSFTVNGKIALIKKLEGDIGKLTLRICDSREEKALKNGSWTSTDERALQKLRAMRASMKKELELVCDTRPQKHAFSYEDDGLSTVHASGIAISDILGAGGFSVQSAR